MVHVKGAHGIVGRIRRADPEAVRDLTEALTGLCEIEVVARVVRAGDAPPVIQALYRERVSKAATMFVDQLERLQILLVTAPEETSNGVTK